ncbi:ATP-binding protein [Roseateles sp. BYS87W]|uniref:histidine kinase n=1 Tax=Pelomonas baiyunensis TaxID=3299026 RepID=A0ABW7H193_9BURK
MAGLPPELEGLPVGVLHVSLKAEVLAANACLREWLAAAPGTLVGQSIDTLLSRAGRVLYHTHLLPTLRLHGRVQELSLALRGPQGTLHVLCSARLLQTPDGAVAQLVLSPMRERLRIEEELSRVQRSADAAPLLLFECVRDVDGRAWMSYASAGIVSLYGIAPEAVHFSDAAWLAHVHPDDHAGLQISRDISATAMSIWRAEFRGRAGDGPWRRHRLLAQPYAEPDGRLVWYGTIVDVTDAVAGEAAALERDAAEQASRSKSEFLARMSHELRTPLNAIIGFSHLLAEDLHRAEPRLLNRVGLIQNAGEHLLHLIDDVLDISRIEAGRLRLQLGPVAVEPLVRQVRDSLAHASQKRQLTLRWHLPEPLAVLADDTRLRQVLTNLVSNAIKYTRDQGCIEVRAEPEGDRVHLTVQDDGPGLTPAQRAQLFQPFNRLGAERGQVEGTGLGLVISRHLVESMGGQLTLDSEVGAGCSFQVSLPRAEPVAEPAPRAAPTPCIADLQPGTTWELLYAEDDPVNALLMQAFLARFPGLHLRVASDGRTACALARELRPDLLLLDMSLPDMDGHALLAALRAQPALADVPAVAVTADAMPTERARALAGGFQAYWTKPLDLHQLPADLTALLHAQLLSAPSP